MTNKKQERVVKKYITITDDEIWDYIDDVMKIPEYSKSFNKVINHALKYGMAELHSKLYSELENKNKDDLDNMSMDYIYNRKRENETLEDYLKEMVQLQKEYLITSIVTKNIVQTLYGAKHKECSGGKVTKEMINENYESLRSMPEDLRLYELQSLKTLREDGEKLDRRRCF